VSRIDLVDEAGREAFPANDLPALIVDGVEVFARGALFELPPLLYEYAALEPVIDAETMVLHHDRHHRAYVYGLNAALAQHPQRRAVSIETILARVAELPPEIRATVHTMGGGHFNHDLFWKVLTPNGGGKPPSDLLRALTRAFGSFDRFRRVFEAVGLTLLGTGWVSLVVDAKRTVEIDVIALPNQDTAVALGKKTLLTCDLWEHAYYLKYRYRRADWLKAWWQIVDWEYVGARFAQVMSAPVAAEK